MGAWGPGSFENDTALDWVADLEAAASPDFLAQTLRRVTEADDYLEVDEGSAAVAAAEVVAALLGAPAPDLPEEVRGWIDAHAGAASAELPPLARRALTRVTTDPERSELRWLWDHASPEHRDACLARVADLERRLSRHER